MSLFGTEYKPSIYAGIAVVSLMILTGSAVALTVMIIPVFVLLSPILVPMVITSSFLVTGFVASGSLGASAIAILVWLYNYRKEEHASYTLHAREVRTEKASKWARGGKLSGGDKQPAEEAKPLERDKPRSKKSTDESKPRGIDQSLEGARLEEEAEQVGVKQTEVGTIIISESEITKVLSEEETKIGDKSCGQSSWTTKRSNQIRLAKDPTIFMKEYQKLTRVGALAYKYFTSRDKKYTDKIHI